jgi:RNase adaptor protein for sRNA GlmZ degradation
LIESQIEDGLRSALIGDHVVLAALYIRNVILPSRLDTQIKNIALQREEQNYQLSQLELEKIQATSNRTIIFLQTQKNSVLAEINLNTTNHELEIENLVQRQLEQTEQELSRLRSERDRDVRVYQKETENLVEAITLNFTIVQEATKRMVTNINTETEAIVSVYDQSTEKYSIGARIASYYHSKGIRITCCTNCS